MRDYVPGPRRFLRDDHKMASFSRNTANAIPVTVK